MKALGAILLSACLSFVFACDDDVTRQTALQVTPPTPDGSTQTNDGSVTETPNTGRLIFVENGSSREPDGSRYAPFNSISDAYAIAESGDTVLLLPGQYGPLTEPPPNVIVQGSGADVTRIDGPWVLAGRDVVIRELSIHGGAPALRIDGTVLLDTVTVTGAETAIEVNGTLTCRGVTVTNIDGPALDTRHFDGPRPSFGSAVHIHETGQLDWVGGGLTKAGWTGLSSAGLVTLTRVNITNVGGPAIYISGGHAQLNNMQLNRVAVAGLLSTGGTMTTEALRIQDVGASTLIPLQTGLAMYGGEATLTGTVIDGVNRGIRMSGGAQASVDDLLITNPRIDGISLDGATLTGGKLTLERPANTGLSAVNMSMLNISDVEISDPGRIGALINTTQAHVRDFSVMGSQNRGLVIQNSAGTFSGLTIGQSGDVGIQITDASGDLSVSGATLVDNATTGIAVTGRTGDVRLNDIQVSSTRVGAAGLAEGLHLFETAVSLNTVYSASNAGAGILVEFSSLTGNGLRLDDNLGPGTVLIESAENTELSDIRAERNRGSGILVLQGHAAINDFHVSGTLADLAAGPGDGINVSFGGVLRLSQGTSDNNAGHGISVSSGCTALLSNVSADSNGGYGLVYDCDASTLSFDGETRFTETNRLGAQTPCQ